MTKNYEAKRSSSSEAKNYECLLIVENSIAEEGRTKLIDKFAKMTGDKDIKVDKWGLKKFATEINHKKDGFYYLVNFASAPDVPKKMADLMNITDGIVRYMFICKDDIKIKKIKPKKKSKPTVEAQ